MVRVGEVALFATDSGWQPQFVVRFRFRCLHWLGVSVPCLPCLHVRRPSSHFTIRVPASPRVEAHWWLLTLAAHFQDFSGPWKLLHRACDVKNVSVRLFSTAVEAEDDEQGEAELPWRCSRVALLPAAV